MKIIFSYNVDRDVQNIINGTQAGKYPILQTLLSGCVVK